MKKILCLLLATIAYCQVHAQLENIPLVTVTGEYSIKAKPDYIILGVAVNKSLAANSTEVKMAFRIFEKEDTRIRLFDFDNKDITETLIQVEKTDNRIVYVKDIFITIKNADKLDEILLELHKTGFTNYKYIDYRLLNLDELKTKARAGALKAAKAKAGQMAGELGQSIGKAHNIEDLETPNYNWYDPDRKNSKNNIETKTNIDGYFVEPGYIIVISKVRVSFDLIK